MPFVEDDSYTTQTRVEAWVQRGTFTSTTKPSLQQVLDAMALRASEITSELNKNGVAASPPTGGAPLPNTSDAQKALKNLCDLVNALMAAGDAIFMHDVRDQAGVERAKALWEEGTRKLEELPGIIATIYASTDAVGVRIATKSGGVAEADFTQQGTAEEKDRGDLFNLDTRW